MENLNKETIEKIILELLKVLKKLEEKENLNEEGKTIKVVENEERTIGRVIGTFAKINNLDVGLKFTGESNNTINLDFNDVLFHNIEKDSLKSIIMTEVDRNSILKKYNIEIE